MYKHTDTSNYNSVLLCPELSIQPGGRRPVAHLLPRREVLGSRCNNDNTNNNCNNNNDNNNIKC